MKTKQLLSTALSLAMVLCMSVPAFAAEPEGGYKTNVVYNAETDNPDYGQGEEYLVTVPAKMAPGETAQVTATGKWASNRKLQVSAPGTVEMKNSLGSGDKTLSITFAGIDQAGSNTERMNITKDITVENITNALFGTWSGTFVYTVGMTDVA